MENYRLTLLSLFFTFSVSMSLLAQPRQQTTVTKHVSDNPSLAVVSFEGPSSGKEQLLRVLQKCGWFRVLPESQAARAQIKLQVQYRENQHSYELLVSPVGQESFRSSAKHENLNEASFLAVDMILGKLFSVPAYCSSPIAFVMPGRNDMREIYSCFLDGSGQSRITNNAAISTEPNWGHRNALVYTLARNNTLSVVLVDMQNRRQRVVSNTQGLNSSASLSPDGRRLALTLSRDGRVDLYLKDLTNNQNLRLTNDIYVESSPCWAPDGETICYVSDRIGKPQLYLMSTGGGQARRLQLGGNECVSPTWSAVSNKLAYAGKSNSGQYVIAVLDMNEKNPMPQIITVAAGDWEAPSWAPDGRHLVCVRKSGSSRDLYLVDSWLKVFSPISKGAKLALPAWAPAY